MYRVLRRGGRAAIVIGQGIYPDRVIPSDRILAEMARGIGFREAEIWIVNKRIATSRGGGGVNSSPQEVAIYLGRGVHT